MPNKVFLEVGVCDFGTCLPLAKSGWSGYMVEADPRYAETMSEQAKPYDIQVDNLAISDIDGYVPFRQSIATDSWVRGIGHVDTDEHMGEKLLDIPDNIRFNHAKITVPAMTLDSYISKNNIDHIDFLKIDVEGHEANVFEGFSFGIKPTLIKIEHSHVDCNLLLERLKKYGYTCWVESTDIYAIV
jgi:FkbM family methyltransferase